jgi:hypothetical protein
LLLALLLVLLLEILHHGEVALTDWTHLCLQRWVTLTISAYSRTHWTCAQSGRGSPPARQAASQTAAPPAVTRFSLVILTMCFSLEALEIDQIFNERSIRILNLRRTNSR